MKNYFIINPVAGKSNSYEFIKELATRYLENNFVIYKTTSPGDAERYVREICNTIKEEKIFYACGGDGTTNEVLNGMARDNLSYLAVIPTGSCNDLCKTFPEYDFMDLELMSKGNYIYIDCLKVNDRYSINIANCGFDAKVNYDVSKMKFKNKNVQKAYNKSIVKRIIFRHDNKMSIETDTGFKTNKKYLLTVFANCCYYGNGINSAPFAKYNDGLIDMILVDSISILKFKKFFHDFKLGNYLSDPVIKKVVTYERCKKITINSKETLCMCLDGETIFDKHFDIEVLNNFIKLIIPIK